MGSFAFWFLIIGLIFIGAASMQMVKISKFSFKNKRVQVKQKMTYLLAGAGVFILLYLIMISIF